jgi:hypothetical protein
VENKARNTLKERGIQARKDERARLLFIQQHQALGAYNPNDKWILIRDPEKQPTPAETDALRANQSRYDHLEQTQKAWDKAYSDDPTEFTNIPIDPMILEHERQFQILQKDL